MREEDVPLPFEPPLGSADRPSPVDAPASTPARPQLRERLVVRRQAPDLIAQTVLSPEAITLADGRVCHAQLGDWRIVHGPLTVDVVSPERFAVEYVPQVVGALTLSPADCAALDASVGLGASRSAATLVAAVERLGAIRIGDVRLQFTPGQLAELQHRALKRGRSVAHEIDAVVDRIRDEIFHHGG